MPVRIHCDLNAAVAHLILDVRQRGATLNQEAPEGVAEIVEAEATQPCSLDGRREVVMDQISAVENSTGFGGEHEIIRDARPALQERLKEPPIPQL